MSGWDLRIGGVWEQEEETRPLGCCQLDPGHVWGQDRLGEGPVGVGSPQLVSGDGSGRDACVGKSGCRSEGPTFVGHRTSECGHSYCAFPQSNVSVCVHQTLSIGGATDHRARSDYTFELGEVHLELVHR